MSGGVLLAGQGAADRQERVVDVDAAVVAASEASVVVQPGTAPGSDASAGRYPLSLPERRDRRARRRPLPVDLAATAASLGANVLTAATIDEFETALRTAVASEVTTVVCVETDPLVGAPASHAWWDVPVAAVARIESTRSARSEYERHKSTQRPYLHPR